MKKLKYSKKIINETNTFIQLIENHCSKLNKEYAKNINKLLERIAKGENLDIKMLKEKYLKSSKNSEVLDIFESNKPVELETSEQNDTNSSEEMILDKVLIDGVNYYYENKENGKIYDSFSNIAGFYKNKQFILNMVQITQLF